MNLRLSDKIELEKKIGHKFKNLQRLEIALTHSSLQKGNNYERLEFLGDRILGLAIAELVIKLFPEATEGELAVRLNGLVNAEVCYQISQELELSKVVKLGADVKALKGTRSVNIYADVLEALIAVIYLDDGLPAVYNFVKKYWEKRALQQGAERRDPKTQLQEWAHKCKSEQPLYRLLERKGPDHDPFFKIEVRVKGVAPAEGEGNSKKMAERDAAKNMLIREKVWEN
ncbi:ribonuclease III [Bartonella sp. DGB1]|uniref:ribonuclease III n=1 Tax=Bartonella sp. DGB1 TaxID=3239807 RepID=UPI003523AF75